MSQDFSTAALTPDHHPGLSSNPEEASSADVEKVGENWFHSLLDAVLGASLRVFSDSDSFKPFHGLTFNDAFRHRR